MAPWLVCQLGTVASHPFHVIAGVTALNLRIPLAIAMIYWWGPRVLPGLMIASALFWWTWGNATLSWASLHAFWEGLTVFSSWAFWNWIRREPLNLSNGRQTLNWLIMALLPAAVLDGIHSLCQSLMPGIPAASDFWAVAWCEATGTLLGGIAIATPLLFFASPWLEKRGFSLTRFLPLPEPDPARRRRFMALEGGLIFAFPAAISLYFLRSDFWIAFATIGVWVALRFGFGVVMAWNVWTVAVTWAAFLLWPTPHSGAVEAFQLARMHLGLAFIGAVTLIIGSTFNVMLREIQARKRSEASLLLTRFTIEHSSEAMIRTDAKGRIVDVNESASSFLGYTREELLGLSIPDFDPYFPMDQWENALKALSRSGSNKIETVHKTKDGTMKPVEIVANYLEFEGEVLICTFVRDISDRIAARERLSQSEARFRSLVENAPDVIVLYDADQGHLIDFNEKACSFFLFSREELLQKNPIDLSPDKQPNGRTSAEMAEEKLQLVKQGQPQQFEWAFKNSRGEETVCDLRLSLFPSHDGMLVRGSILDISARKRLESELHKAQKLESLGILAGGIAHDFNNLVGGIFGYIDMALTKSMDSKAADYLASAMRSIDRARGLTQQLLTFARGGEPRKKPQPLHPFLEEAARFALSGSNVDCRFQIPEDLWICEFDRNQISQVIDNLVINAMQAMPSGGIVTVKAENVRIAKGAHPTLDAGDFVRIAILDQGEGIPQANLSRIFDPFFTTKAKGHGLGLATCYSIISRHGGHIEVDSEPGKGTAFHIYLPSSEKPPLPDPDPVGEDFAGEGCFILMDDDAGIRESIGAMLSSLGYEVQIAEHGQEAIDAFQSLLDEGKDVAGMLFDLTVPGHMGGREAVARVKALRASVPVFVMSGYAEDPVMANPMDYGFQGSICKPFVKGDLAQLLRAYMTA